MNFEFPSIAWLLPLCGLLLSGWILAAEIRRRRVIASIGDRSGMARMGNSLSEWARRFRALLVSFGVLLSVVALANPQVEGETTFRQYGMDIVFVYDFSDSMLSEDVYPNRLARSLREAESLSADLLADRIAAVLFAGGTVHFPLTQDHNAVRLLYQGVSPAHIAQGADIGQALKLAYCILRSREAGSLCDILQIAGGGQPLYGELREIPQAEAPRVKDRSRVIVLFSDGEDLQGRAEAEAEIARELGIELFVVPVGQDLGGLLRRLTDSGSARYFPLMENEFSRSDLLAELKMLKRGDLSEREINDSHSIFDYFLIAAFLALFLESLWSSRRLRKLVMQ